MFEYGGLVLAGAAVGGLAATIGGIVITALTDTAPLEAPFVERRTAWWKVLKKAA